MRKVAHIVSGKTKASACPNCLTVLDGITAAQVGGFFRRLELKGKPTLCCYCGALLVFADNLGRVRTMTEAERNSVHFAPVIQEILEHFRKRARPRDFTKKDYSD